MKKYILSAIDNNYKNKTIVDIDPSTSTPGGYFVDIITTSNELNLSQSQIMARNVVVAAYDAIYERNFPIIYVSFTVYDEDNKEIFILGMGKNIAGKVGRDKWNLHSGNTAFSVDEFLDFVRKNQADGITPDFKTHYENRCFSRSKYL